MGLVLLDEFPDRIAADVARLTLAAEGIEAVIFDSGMASLGFGFMTPARVMVAAADRWRAACILGIALPSR